MDYSNSEVLKEIETLFDELVSGSKQFDDMYNHNSFNRIGKTNDKEKKEYYTEIIAEKLLSNLCKLYSNLYKQNNTCKITRETSYYTKTHSEIKLSENSSSKEENLAKEIILNQTRFMCNCSPLGIFIDYQIPLKNKQKDKAGKIDLLSINPKLLSVYFIELKAENNDETLLRAILEIFTYYMICDKKKLIKDYYTYCPEFKKIVDLYNIKKLPSLTCKPSVLLEIGCNPYKELGEMIGGDRPMLKKLIRLLGVEIYSIDSNFVIKKEF